MLINLFAQQNHEKKIAKIKYLTNNPFFYLFYLLFTLTSDEAKHQIAFILEKISELRPAEKLLLYLKMPGGQSEVGELLLLRLLVIDQKWFSQKTVQINYIKYWPKRADTYNINSKTK